MFFGDEPQPWTWEKHVDMDSPLAISEPVKIIVTAEGMKKE
ncbi:MAG: hypothetical protein ACRD3W_14690 [Terriglobales bacterium]